MLEQVEYDKRTACHATAYYSNESQRMNDASRLIADATRRLFRELGQPHSMRDVSQRARLWTALHDAGLTRAWVGEEWGGAGAALRDGFEVLRIAGEFAVSVPLAEHLLASWLLARARIQSPDTTTVLASVNARDAMTLDTRDRLAGIAHGVPFAREAERLAILARRGDAHFVALVASSDCVIEARDNIAGEPCDRVTLREARPLELRPTDLTTDSLLQMGAAARAMQIAGALQGMLTLTVNYANERVAFEKPIGKFQAIQHALARLASETAAVVAAATSAADAIDSAVGFDEATFLEVASAKVRAGEAVGVATAIAHQTHGAIGFTEEHVLQRYTRRLWAWRDDFGAESEWAWRLGQWASNIGVGLWPALAAR